MKIQVAIARKILVAVWHMLSKEEDFIDIYLKRQEELNPDSAIEKILSLHFIISNA
ncbi:hypothetical protein TFUB22_01684 [Tannerella forsythia]|nr:hypothetical protein TFUB22_01684 [Tannerella forsythia]